jgi:hypothetical protein
MIPGVEWVVLGLATPPANTGLFVATCVFIFHLLLTCFGFGASGLRGALPDTFVRGQLGRASVYAPS